MTARLLQLVSNQKANTSGSKASETRLEQQLQRLAMRIADNRIVAGVHFPIDSTAGRMLGETLATYIAYRCGNRASKSWIARKFNGKPKGQDGKVIVSWLHPFNRHDALDKKTNDAPFFQDNDGTPRGAGLPPWTVVSNGKSFLHWLWNKAQREWT